MKKTGKYRAKKRIRVARKRKISKHGRRNGGWIR